MRLHRKDVARSMIDPRWEALHLVVEDMRKPRLQVQAIAHGLLRLALDDVGLVWARVDDEFYGYDLLVTAQSASRPIIPPILFAFARRLTEGRSADEGRRRWAHTITDWLESSDATPLHDGDWLLEGYSQARRPLSIAVDAARDALSAEPERYVDWDHCVPPLLLRRASAPDHGRVNAWRKFARIGALPPVVLLWIDGLAASVVLDGHDRLQAAALEGVDAPMLMLSRTNPSTVGEPHAAALLGEAARLAEAARLSEPEDTKAAVDSANLLAAEAYRTNYDHARTRAFPLRGGADRWRAEVRSQVRDSDSELLR